MVPRCISVIRSPQADEGQFGKLNVPPVATLTFTNQHYQAISGLMAPQDKFGLIGDPLEFNDDLDSLGGDVRTLIV